MTCVQVIKLPCVLFPVLYLAMTLFNKTGYWLLRLSTSPKALRTRMKWIPTISLPTLLGKVTLCMKRLNVQQWTAARGGGLCVVVSL